MIPTSRQGLILRPFRLTDADALSQLANDRDIWRNVRDSFPHPYDRAAADAFLAKACGEGGALLFAIEADGALAGGAGLHFQQDVERRSVEVGYWLGRPFWGQGIATLAVSALTAHGFATKAEIHRVFAGVYAWNEASSRVLEKCGFTLEGRLRQDAFKDGEFVDRLIYGRLRSDP